MYPKMCQKVPFLTLKNVICTPKCHVFFDVFNPQLNPQLSLQLEFPPCREARNRAQKNRLFCAVFTIIFVVSRKWFSLILCGFGGVLKPF